jgi:glycosyltransferase involved in cell wall biosynthesis
VTPRTLLIVSYHFAPSPAVGGKRFTFLAREFARQGYDVHVITHEERESPLGAADPTLPLAGRVHRCAAAIELPLRGAGLVRRKLSSALRRVLEPVSAEYFWAHAATRAAVELFGQRRERDAAPGVVIATSPPHAALIAGARIARRLGWPLILDYRDPWSGHDWPRWRRTEFANGVARRVEAPLVAASAARVLNTPALRDAFERHFPDAPTATNFVIPNGFDAVGPPPPLATTGAVNLVHAGEIYTGRSLLPVLQAAQRLRARRPERPIRVTTYGELPAIEAQRIRDAGLWSLIDVRPRVPLARLFGELQAAHALIAIVGDHMLYSTPYKVYDYMAAGRPILGLAPKGAALFGLLAESGAGLCFEPGDVAGIENALEKIVLGDAPAAGARVERFQWSNLALQYQAAIESVIEPRVKPEQAAAPGTTSRTAPAGRSASARWR